MSEMTDTKAEPVKPCECCGNPRGNCMKLAAEHILNLPAFREVLRDPAEDGDGRDQITENIEAQNKRRWAEFNARYEQLEAEHLQVMAATNRQFNRRMRMINILYALGIVALIILAWVRLGALE